MRRLRLLLTIVFLLGVQLPYARQIHFVFLSDPHYGLEREFRGHDATAEEVCRAMAEAVRALPGETLPEDGGAGAGEAVGCLDFVVCGGDIANRMQHGVQTAAASWKEFERTWYAPGMPPMKLLPGNHDISNAIGYTKPLSPARDATAAAEIYNRTMLPDTPRTAAAFDYTTDKVFYAFTLWGVRFAFAGMWPDSQARAWLKRELAGNARIPCLLFTHMEPQAGARRFTNPYGDHSVNRTDGFENLICDTCSVGVHGTPVKEYRAAAALLRTHPAIKAWFHGHTNYNEFYVWHGPDNDLAIDVFRVDSPLKGEVSAADETQLSFQVVCIDTRTQEMTVREYFWNATGPAAWGASRTVKL